jgi:formyl-CoA transferase
MEAGEAAMLELCSDKQAGGAGMEDQPLSGLRILDLSRVLAGPYCTMILGDLGADVIKVEPPEGDETRGWGPPLLGGESAYYLCVNRNKRGMILDLKNPDGQKVVRELASRSDVLVENFRPGTLERFGLDPAALRGENPGLVTCSISGFGQTGPRRDQPGYDFMIQAMGGVMSFTGEPGGQPIKVGVAVTDVIAGLYAVIAIQGALAQRQKTSQGQQLDISLFDTQLAWLVNVGSNYLVSGESPKRYGNAHANIVPYQSFSARDGYFCLTVGNDRQFIKLCELMGHPEWSNDPRFSGNRERVENRDTLIPLLQGVFQERPAAEWLGMLEGAGIPCGPILTLDRVFAEPQVAAREMLIRMEHPVTGRIPMVASPLKMDATPVRYRLSPPRAGEHTREVLHEVLGYSDRECRHLLEAKAALEGIVGRE